MALAAIASVAVSGCGGSDEPRAPAQTVSQRYAEAVQRVADVRERLDLHEPPGDVRARQAAEACLAAWRAAPSATRQDPLLRYWEIAVTREAAKGLRRAIIDFKRTVETLPAGTRVKVVSRTVRLGDVRDHLAAELRYYDRLYAIRGSTCAAVKAWRRAGWRHAAMPPAIRRVIDARAIARVLLRPNVQTGVALLPPDHNGYCGDRVFETLAPEDTFCG